MFSIEDLLSQGDKGLELGSFSGDIDDQCYLNQDFVDLEFLDSIAGKSDLTHKDTTMNLDLKELLADVLAGEPMDISLLNVDSAIPVSELSYNLNNPTLQGDLISLKADIPTSELSYDLATSANIIQQSKTDSFEVSESAVVSSTTNAFFDLLEEENSLDETLTESDKSEITESVAGKKYLEMRRKNNIASQRSRKIRKQKNSKMSERLKELEKENKELSLLADGLEKEKNTLQELLMSIIAKKS